MLLMTDGEMCLLFTHISSQKLNLLRSATLESVCGIFDNKFWNQTNLLTHAFYIYGMIESSSFMDKVSFRRQYITLFIHKCLIKLLLQ